MNNKQKFQILLNISLFSSISFFLLCALAMYFYPGGSMYNNPANPLYNSSITSYSHTMNFFSDLGLHYSWSRQPNFISNIFFAYGLLSVAIGIVSFYTSLHFILRKDKELILLSKFGIFIALLSSIGFILVSFTPSDMLLSEHMFSVNLGFRSFLIIMLIYSYAIFRSNYIENYLALIYFGLFCLVAYYVYILIAGPELVSVSYRHKDFFIPTKQAVLFHVVSQKFVIYGLNFSILWQLIEFKKQKYIDLIE